MLDGECVSFIGPTDAPTALGLVGQHKEERPHKVGAVHDSHLMIRDVTIIPSWGAAHRCQVALECCATTGVGVIMGELDGALLRVICGWVCAL